MRWYHDGTRDPEVTDDPSAFLRAAFLHGTLQRRPDYEARREVACEPFPGGAQGEGSAREIKADGL